jgi:hypothetical protein
MPTIYKDYLNIEPIESGNPFTIVIIDSSSYFRYPEGAALDVTIPGYNDFFEVPFKPSLVNVYNSSTLGLNQLLCVDGLTALPDGVWKYRYKVCPYDQTFVYRSFYKTSLLDERIKQIYNEIDLRACNNNDIDYLKNQVVRIHILREGARAVVEINERKAYENYQAALDLADQIIERNCHNCKIR